MKRLFGLLCAFLLIAALFSGCAGTESAVYLDASYMDAEVGGSIITILNGEVEKAAVAAELDGDRVTMHYDGDALTLEDGYSGDHCDITCRELAGFVDAAMEELGETYQGYRYTISVMGSGWELIDPAVNDAVSYVYDLSAGKLVPYAEWTKGFESYAGFGGLQYGWNGDVNLSNPISVAFCR